jgi:cytochrome c
MFMEIIMRANAFIAFVAFLCLAGPSFANESETMKRLATGDAVAGKNIAKVCAACHSLEAGGGPRVGPNIYGILNSDVASVPGFNYSDALIKHGGKWSPERLDAFLGNAMQVVPGTSMGFPGIADAQDRANLIAYLNTLSDSPLASIGSAVGAAGAPSKPKDFGKFVPGKGVDVTYYNCMSCHSEMIIVQQGKTRDKWDELLVQMVEEHGMNELIADDREIILDYLSEFYNTDRANFPR